MNDVQALPVHQLALQLDPTSSDFPPDTDLLAQAVRAVLERLGLPGQVMINVSTAPAALPEARLFELQVGGTPVSYPDDLARRAAEIACLRHLPGRMPKVKLLAELEAEPGRRQEFYTLALVEVLQLSPQSLLDEPTLAAYISTLPPAEGGWTASDAGRLLPVFRQALALNVSLSDVQTVGRLAQASPGALTVDDLLAALRPTQLEILLNEETLRTYTNIDPNNETGLFSYIYTELFDASGVVFPPGRFRLAAHLKPGCFAFKINHYESLPRLGLAQDEILVNDTVENLALINIEGRPAVLPDSGFPGAVISAAALNEQAAAYLTTWNMPQHLVRCMGVDLRSQAACIIDQPYAARQLDSLAASFPALVDMFRASPLAGCLAPLMRLLVSEQLSIRDLRGILERLLDWPGVGTPEPEILLEFVRQDMAESIASKLARGYSFGSVYLLDPEIDRLLEAEPVPAADAEAIQNAVRVMLAYLSPTVFLPSIITSQRLRRKLRQLLAPVFPDLAVVAYEELPPNASLQAVDRITL